MEEIVFTVPESTRGQHEPILREIDWYEGSAASHKSKRSKRSAQELSARSHVSGNKVVLSERRQNMTESRNSSETSITTPESKMSIDISEESEYNRYIEKAKDEEEYLQVARHMVKHRNAKASPAEILAERGEHLRNREMR